MPGKVFYAYLVSLNLKFLQKNNTKGVNLTALRGHTDCELVWDEKQWTVQSFHINFLCASRDTGEQIMTAAEIFISPS